MNIYYGKSDANLNVWTVGFAATVGGNTTGYKTTTTKVTAVTTAQSVFDSAILDFEAAKAAFAAASDAKAAARQSLLSSISVVTRDIYGGGVSDSMVSAAGLEPRDAVRTPVVPLQPTELMVTPFADGTVQLKWNRNGNARNMNFIVESAVDGESWAIVNSTSKSRITLSGYAPGNEAFFRVRATKDGDVSEPSNTEAIYLPTPSATSLKVAA